MDVRQFVYQEKQRLDKFMDFWKTKLEEEPDTFTEDLVEADWLEQYVFWRDSQR